MNNGQHPQKSTTSPKTRRDASLWVPRPVMQLQLSTSSSFRKIKLQVFKVQAIFSVTLTAEANHYHREQSIIAPLDILHHKHLAVSDTPTQLAHLSDQQTYTYISTHIYTPHTYMNIGVCTYAHIYIHTYLHTHICKYKTHTCMLTHMHACSHTRTHIINKPLKAINKPLEDCKRFKTLSA